MTDNETIFTKNKSAWQESAKNIDAKFHEDPTDGAVTDNRKQKDGRTDLISTQGILSYFVKNRLLIYRVKILACIKFTKLEVLLRLLWSLWSLGLLSLLRLILLLQITWILYLLTLSSNGHCISAVSARCQFHLRNLRSFTSLCQL